VFTARDEATKKRMLTVRDVAAATLDVRPLADSVSWGWWGRSIGCKVTTRSELAWLRVRAVPAGDGYGRMWEGNVTASQQLPATVRRPLLIKWQDFTADAFDYRAELYEYLRSPVCAPEQFLREELSLPDEWWASLRNGLTALSAVETDRVVVSQRYITSALPRYLEAPGMPVTPPRWAASHGDLHWANLTKDGPVILDWETWGMAPAGYDVAQLAAFSVFAPMTQARLREELSLFLDTPEGRFAELTVLAELLHMTTRGEHVDATDALRKRARALVRFCERVDWR
jgi:hypothetical protein